MHPFRQNGVVGDCRHAHRSSADGHAQRGTRLNWAHRPNGGLAFVEAGGRPTGEAGRRWALNNLEELTLRFAKAFRHRNRPGRDRGRDVG
jgi:hypothetical protein